MSNTCSRCGTQLLRNDERLDLPVLCQPCADRLERIGVLQKVPADNPSIAVKAVEAKP